LTPGSERQYVYQLSKWGVRKQVRGLTAAAGNSPAALDDVHDHQDQLKRRRPSASVRSFSSADSGIVKPPKKKIEQNFTGPRKLLFDSLIDDAEHGSVERVHSCWTKSVSPTTTNTSNTSCPESSGIPEAKSETLDLPADDYNNIWSIIAAAAEEAFHADAAIVPLTLPDCTPSTQILAPSTWIRASGQCLFPPMLLECGTVGLLGGGVGGMSPVLSPTASAQTIRSIDHDRPVDTFSGQDIADIKQAAECLAIFCCYQEAFELYITILKRQFSDPTYRGTSFWYLLIQCVHTASSPEHVAVVRNIVHREIDRFKASHDVSHAHQFLVHMLLAFICNRVRNPDGMQQNLCDARVHAGTHDVGFSALLTCLPSDDRSLDLVLYHNFLRVRAGDSCDLISPAAFKFTSFGPLPEKMLHHEDHILIRAPGPFEIQENGRMANPCIRSCLVWCNKALQVMVSLSITPGILDFREDGIVAWAETNALFIALWEHWAEKRSSDKSIWMSETQARMGISASELLLLVCRSIHDLYNAWMPPGPRQSEAKLLRHLRTRAESMLCESDLQLAKRFLDQYVARNTVTMWPPPRRVVQNLEKARMIKCFEKVLHVKFPNLGVTSMNLINSVLVPLKDEIHHEQQDELPVVVLKAQQPSPTLASSLSSIDLSNFKKTRVSAALQLRKFARGSSSTLSLLSLGRSGNKVSITGISDLSTSLRSMSISSDSAGSAFKSIPEN
jgi:hypothetical protein